MAGSCWPLLLPVLALLLVAPIHVHGGASYVITTPRQWIAPGTSQVCLRVLSVDAPAGTLNISVTVWDSSRLPEERNQTIAQQHLDVPAGKFEQCQNITIPKVDTYNARVHIKGNVSGLKLNDTVEVRIQGNTEKTFIQTDKYLYRPGEKVQFRILTVFGNKVEVYQDEYPEIYVNTPSRTRVAQWKNVTGNQGLLHLDFQLADEPEEGFYTIFVNTKNRRSSQNFKVEEFVLPRYEVTIKKPPYILATDDNFAFTACANYTYGQPVKGNISFVIDNNQDRKCRVTKTTNTTINGCIEVHIQANDMNIIDCSVYSISASAVVEEEGTGVQLKAQESISITRNAVRFKTLYKDDFMKPNIPFSLKMRAELPDGSPASGVPMEICAAGSCNNDTTAADGVLDIVLPDYRSNSVIMKALNCRAGMRSSEHTENIEHYFSPSNSSLLILASEHKLKCSPSSPREHVLPIMFSARDQPTADITVQVISRGHIQHSSTQTVTLASSDLPFKATSMVGHLPPPLPGTVRGVAKLFVTLPPTASPKARILVWYARADSEVVSDVRELQVENCLANNVTLGWSKKQAEPGEAATLTVNGEPQSVCSLGVVDRSVELLARDPDPITANKLFRFAESFTISKWTRSQIDDNSYCKRRQDLAIMAEQEANPNKPIAIPFYRYYTSYVDAIHMFSDAGVYVLTDLTVETRPCEKDEHHFGGGFGGGPVFESAVARPPPVPLAGVAFSPDKAGVDDITLDDGGGSQTDSPRTNFPETWLWDLVVVPATGTLEQQVTVPDTITQWVGKAVCVHPEAGVGLSGREPITTFTPFFVDLTLPPTVKRKEILPIKMSVFNYNNQDLPISLLLEDSTEYEILEETGIPPSARGKRSACVPANDKTVLTVRVRPTVVADVNLNVSAAVDAADFPACGAGANSPQRRDALVKPIKVEADGFPREVTWNKYICSKDFQTGEDSLEQWNLTLPATIVEGSSRGWVTAVGDLLALSLENLGHLIRMPYGCGEQNMLNFAPNIYLLRYLDITRQATPDATEKLMRYMNTGYQRQLLYRRSNGSFSAFGNADDSGSTWLTAFVLKSFKQAEKYIQIDDQKLNQTRDWLLQQQGKDGCFIAVGKILHKSMQGGVSNSKTPAPLTAYVLTALLEGGDEPSAKPVAQAIKCLIGVSSLHPYTLALKAYALALAGDAQASTALDELVNVGINTTNSLSWKLPEGSGRSRAASVEVAGYAILTMMTLDPTAYESQARKVVKWLTTQRNGQGGFYSTQDTVVALQALALYESNRHQGPLDVAATVTADGLNHVFSVSDHNKLLQQLVPLPVLPTTVTLGMTGEGCAVLQGVLRYNVPTPEGSDIFDLTVNTITVPDRNCVTKRITACASYRLVDGASNMVIIEVNLVSGYIPEKDDLKRLVAEEPRLKRYEVDGSKINFYAEELRAEDTCVNFRVTRIVDVENVKPGSVVVYDYYQDEFSISQRYTFPPNDECR